MPADRFQQALEEITLRFAMEVVELIRTTTVQELTSLAQPPEAAPLPGVDPEKPAKRRGRPPKTTIEAAPGADPEKPSRRRGRPPKAESAATTKVEATKVVGAAPAPAAKPKKKKRNWPTCSVEGCGGKMYPGSGKNRFCYGHHLDAGGKQSPLLGRHRTKSEKR